jgi:hypothetical protein
MCGKSKALIDSCKIKMRLGGLGGSISINETGIKSDTIFYGSKFYAYPGDNDVTAEMMKEKLTKLGTDNLATMVLQLVENGAEL